MVRSIFSKQEKQNTPCSEQFWKLGRGKMAGHCGAKRIFKSRNTKHTMFGALLEVGAWKNGIGHCGAKHVFKSRNTKHTMLGALLEVGVWKNGRSLWCEAYFQNKKYKAHHARSTFGS